MRIRSVVLLAPLAGALLFGIAPTAAAAQGRTLTMTLTAVVPSVVRYVVDESTRTADGAPTVRVISNDPLIRAAFARGVTPERAPLLLASATPEASAHAKGDARIDLVAADTKLLRYTVVTP
ncbi:MAG TPA: hypothetical protein VF454_07380 [Gemmatimonadales bacterium]